MVQISLVLAPSVADTELNSFATQARLQLEGLGHDVELLLPPKDSDKSNVSSRVGIGLAQAATHGLRRTVGDIVVVADPSMGYDAEDVIHVVNALVRDQADVVVATRSLPLAGRLLRTTLGTSDPLSGLFGLSSAFRDEVVGGLNPVGSKLLWPLLGTKAGRWLDVAVTTKRDTRRLSFGFNDIREFKRLADIRFGNISRLFQFCVVGASGMVVDLTCYVLFQKLLASTSLSESRMPVMGGPGDLAVARALAIAFALCWNFSLNRRLTFNYARNGSIVRQFMTYCLSNALGVALSFTVGITLPERVGFFADHKLAAAVVGIVLATGISFTMSRWVVFSNRPAPVAAEPV